MEKEEEKNDEMKYKYCPIYNRNLKIKMKEK
jgi:hypothetical protein